MDHAKPSPPTRLAAWKNRHAGDTIIVCGCGRSLLELPDPKRWLTIGVNDVGRLFDPTYLVVLNPKSQFAGDRFRFVSESRARVLFTQLDARQLSLAHPAIVRFRLGRFRGIEVDSSDSLPYARNSPYLAVCLAAYMGARRIGLIGVDFTDHHFFGNTGRHALTRDLDGIDREYKNLASALARRGVDLVNLSRQSRLRALPKADPVSFLSGESGARPVPEPSPAGTLRIVSYATTPVAGVAAILARCIDASTSNRARCVWATRRYGNGVEFTGDIEWTERRGEALAALGAADVLIVHNGKVDPQHRSLLAGKPIITMAHNYLWNVDQTFVKRGMPGAVVGQYQATLPEFSGWSVVPNPIPLWEPAYQPEPKPDRVTIAYTPSGKHERYPDGHRLYWHGKGYDTTMRVLDGLAKRYPLALHVIRERPITHDEALAMKRRAHIVIDECVTGSYHRNSLEGLAAGCVVVNGVGLLPGVVDALRRCAGAGSRIPFVHANLETLEEVLATLVESGGAALEASGAENRQWMEQHWAFGAQWQQHWAALVDRARDGSRTKPPVKRPVSTGIRTKPAQANWVEGLEHTSAAVPLLWTCRGTTRGNFGDMLSPLIVGALSGRTTRYEPHGPRLLAVGSLLKFAHRGDAVWGTGFIASTDRCDRHLRVYAVRGPRTRRKLLELGCECPEVYGDPALLLPWLYRLPEGPRRGIGIVPHYVDAARINGQIKDPNVRIIDVRAGVERVLSEIGQCEVLLSSSLHGCVVGDAYGIPTAWVRISDKVVGGAFKFEDYYEGTGREAICVDWRHGINIDAGIRAASGAAPPRVDLEALLRSFPLRARTLQNLASLPVRQISPLPPLQSIRTAPRIRPARPAIEVRDRTVAPPQRTTDDSTSSRLAVFSTGTENYAKYIVTSLRSFMRHARHERFDYFIFGRAFSSYSRDVLQRFGIQYVDLDLTSVFRRRRRDRYPSECFWIFKGPEIFYERGYDFSLSVDGDVWCNRPLALDWLANVKHLAGIHRGNTVAEFLSRLGGYPQLKRHFGIADDAARRPATNSGVLFYNNKALVEFRFFERLVDLYVRSESLGVRRGGDDSTLSLLLGVYPDVDLFALDRTWNAYHGLARRVPSLHGPRGHALASWITQARIVHFAGLKPWVNVSRYPNDVCRHYVSAWRNLWRDVDRRQVRTTTRLSGGAYRHREPHRQFPVRCYWYRGARPNFGDEVAPYLIRKVAGLSQHETLQERPADPRTIAEPVLLSVGSILRLCGPNALVWGSGIRNIDQQIAPAKRFLAVRGPLTRRRLLQLGYDCPPRYGDPALLLPRYFRPTIPQQYALGIIPHHCDYAQLAKVYGRRRDVLVINVCTSDIERLIVHVLSCRATVSTGLHGLVVSAAYGIPTRWLKCSSKIKGDDSKFYDFFASLHPRVEELLDRSSVTLPEGEAEFEPYRPIRMNGRAIPPQDLAAQTFKHEINVNLDELLDACPVAQYGWKVGVLD